MEPKTSMQSRTIWFAAALAALGVVQVQIPAVIPPQWQGYVTLGTAAAIAFLRVITEQPVKGIV